MFFKFLNSKSCQIKNKSNRGFTIIEILTYIGIFSIIIVMLSVFIISANRSSTKIQTTRTTIDNVERVLQRISYEIKGAKSIYTPTTNSTQLSLETLYYLPEGESSTFIDFFVCGTQICLKKESFPPIALTSENVFVKDLSFNQIAATSTIPSIQINLTLEYKNPQNRSEYQSLFTATTTASMRTY